MNALDRTLREVLIGRQPILDLQQELVGYELLFRTPDCTDASPTSGCRSAATAGVVCSAFAELGIGAALGPYKAYINTDERFILDDALELLPPQSVVLELDFTSTPDSELLAPDCRKLLHDSFGTEPIDVFGSFETDNIAWQCERRSGYHVAIDCAVVEVLAADGRPLGPGEGTGDLVVTVLGNFAMPFIRYNLRDRAAWLASDCSCGRSLPLLDVTAGRADDLLTIGSERRSPMRLLGRFDRLGTAVSEYRVLQLAADELLIEVVPGPDWQASLEPTLLDWVAREDGALRARVATVASIPRAPSGKYKAFESRLEPPAP